MPCWGSILATSPSFNAAASACRSSRRCFYGGSVCMPAVRAVCKESLIQCMQNGQQMHLHHRSWTDHAWDSGAMTTAVLHTCDVGQPAMLGCTPSRSPLKTGCPARAQKDTWLSVGRWYQAVAQFFALCPSYPSSQSIMSK